MIKIVVIGGANTDICGAPAGRLIMNDSNPGCVTVRLGGVGRNIAHNLCNLGADVTFITAVGEDTFADNIMSQCKALGMNMSMSVQVPNMRSSTYLYVKDETGDMHIGISEMDVIQCITPDVIETCMDRINEADAVVIDANLSQETITYIAEHCTKPLFADAVSTVKAVKLIRILDKLTAIKPNKYEAEKLTGEPDPEKAAVMLVNKGVKMAFVSMGEKGMVVATKNGTEICHPEYVRTVDATGAGDASMSAIVYAAMMGKTPSECMTAASKAGAITAASEETNSPLLTAAAIGIE